jgi:hypothetical protein
MGEVALTMCCYYVLDVVLLEVVQGIQDEQSYRQEYDALLPFTAQTAGEGVIPWGFGRAAQACW